MVGRCLQGLLRAAELGELEVIVVANGCDDHTADISRSFGSLVQVIELGFASKAAALNQGDAVATAFPRMYIDADVEIDTGAIRRVASVLSDGQVRVAAPQLKIATGGRSWAVRAFYDVWQQLPFVTDDHVGTGFYGLSEAGRAAFSAFPSIVADDLFVRSLFTREQRRAVPGCFFVIYPPTTLRSIVQVRTRVYSSSDRERAHFGGAVESHWRSHRCVLRGLARSPAWWPRLGVYIGVVLAARFHAARKKRRGGSPGWERDESTRLPSQSPPRYGQ